MAGISRRALLRRSFRADADSPLRPPWATEQRIASDCTACGRCIEQCPEGILFSEGGRPYVKTGISECTFCGRCAEACAEAVFDLNEAPWSLTAQIGDSCFLKTSVDCRLCTDACEPRALRFDLRVRPVGAVQVTEQDCTGCGACLVSCPTNAITLTDRMEGQQNA
ncbi:ferredoxin-type protein NapF [Coralliovum pocilloporae]|uniref:ferredoxin-type protein NapF n=1 Tax=Coralliovum pocilloporae TaxID=3066369 RepID=UPI0033075EAC